MLVRDGRRSRRAAAPRRAASLERRPHTLAIAALSFLYILTPFLSVESAVAVRRITSSTVSTMSGMILLRNAPSSAPTCVESR